MRNLWMFVSKYNAFFLFIIFFVISLIFVGSNNPYQRTVILNSSNDFIGRSYEQIDNLKDYLSLSRVNDSLVAENANLRNQLKSSFADDSIRQKAVNDTLYKQQYTTIEARVVRNTVNRKNNYITINRGRAHGISLGMGVIGSAGVVGIVRYVNNNYSIVQSLLHSRTKISASIEGSNAFGSLVWGPDNFNSQTAFLLDIPNHIVVKNDQRIVTSGFSLFPAGTSIGKIIRRDVKGCNNFLDIELKLSTDFSTLQYVYVINNLRAAEQQELETQIPEDE